MNKALCVAAAVALALSSTAFAKGGSKHRAQAQATTDAQISMSDCNTLSVESARNDCMRWVQAHGGASAGTTSAQTSVGATGSTSGGMTQGGGKIRAKAAAVRERAANMRDRALSRLPARSTADPASTSESAPAPQR